MQCRNNNDNDHNNSCDQNSQYIIFCIQHEGKNFHFKYTHLLKNKELFFELEK